MKFLTLLGVATALGMVGSPAASHTRASMHHMSRAEMKSMRACHRMSHDRMMHNRRCIALMRRHHHMMRHTTVRHRHMTVQHHSS